MKVSDCTSKTKHMCSKLIVQSQSLELSFSWLTAGLQHRHHTPANMLKINMASVYDFRMIHTIRARHPQRRVSLRLLSSEPLLARTNAAFLHINDECFSSHQYSMRVLSSDTNLSECEGGQAYSMKGLIQTELTDTLLSSSLYFSPFLFLALSTSQPTLSL